ncbi:MAG: hypothetical protein HRT35_29880, partial [Algicola sp.]|nr:hypothetical protein [Algicola sp.]
TTSYNWCAADCPAGAVYFIIKASDDRSPTVTYYSETGRELRKRTVAMDGRYNHIDRQFDSLGQNTHVSEPYFVGDTIYWTITVFDTQGRPVQTTNPDGSVTNTSYNGLTTTSTNVLGHIKVQVKDVLGNQLAVTDNAGGTILLNFDGFNQLLQTQDPNGNTTTLSYNSRGWKTAMSDPNKGSWSYQYNAKGELTSQTDAKGQTIQSTYDLLGRITSRIDKRSDASIQNNSNWYYDNSADPDGGASPTMALGKLHWVEETVSGYRQIQLYDALSRKSQTLTRLDGNDYSQHVTYDSFSRVQDSFDVSGSGIRHFYNANGQLEKRQDISSTNILGTVYWQAITQDARGNVTQQKLGNGSDVYRVFNAQTGRIDDIVTLGATTQVLQYQYDVAGNLQQRYEQSDVKMLTENFSYDNMNRLVAANVVGGAQQTISYDLMGNILTKTGLSGTYQYGGSCNGVTAGPHAVTSAGGQSYCYDNNGNQISGNGRTLQYSVFDKPVDISKGSHNTQFGYGPARHRFKRTDIDNEKAETTTTHYLGNVEVITRPTGVVEYKRAINGGVIVTTRSNGTSDVRYLHKDHLGSIDMITDESGLLVQSLSFDAFGKRRDTLSWDQFADPYFQLANINDILNITTRGFTGHEMLDQVGLIHMGGRVFDAHLGRFLQADPIIQAPTNSQSYNRYSYVLNNPLSYTDPSGFFFKSLKKFIKKYWRPILAAIAVIVTIGIATPLVASLGAIWGTAATATSAASLTFMGSAVVGAISGAVSGAIMTGSLEGAWKGAVTGALMGGVNGYFGNSWNMQRVAANGVAKGITARINGGKFMDGLKGSLATSLLTLANYRMRADMVRQSKINPDNIGKDSKGFFGDGHGIAGTRRIVNPDFGRVPGVAKYLKCDGPAGGCQGPVLPGSTDVGSRVGPISYKAGSIYDTLTESFSGPHDWLSDKIGMYDAQGNGIHRSGFIGGFYSTASAVLIPVAAPFAVAGLIETQPGLFR